MATFCEIRATCGRTLFVDRVAGMPVLIGLGTVTAQFSDAQITGIIQALMSARDSIMENGR